LKLTLFMSERTPTTVPLLSMSGVCSCEMATAPSAAIAAPWKRSSSRMQLMITGSPEVTHNPAGVSGLGKARRAVRIFLASASEQPERPWLWLG
jgi:hypothetical protein